jgi:hypothetical protein
MDKSTPAEGKVKLNTNIIWLSQDLNVGIDKHLLKGVKKLGISRDFRFLIWNNETIPMQYTNSFRTIESINYVGIGPKFVEAVRHIYTADGRTVTVLKYNHNKKGFVVDHIKFSNIEFRDLK